MKQERKFKGKSIDMLMACSTLMEHVIENQSTLIERRPDWADPYFPDLQTRIHKAFSDIIGVSSVETLKNATRNLTSVQQNALKALGDFNIQLDVAYHDDKNRLKALRALLGMEAWYLKAMRKNQEALIQLLYTFKSNLSDEIKTELSSKGVPEALMTSIADAADPMKAANVSQEQAKGGRKEITQAGVDELNAIYRSVIGIAKIASRFFLDDPVKKELFSYAKVLRQLSKSTSKEDIEETMN